MNQDQLCEKTKNDNRQASPTVHPPPSIGLAERHHNCGQKSSSSMENNERRDHNENGRGYGGMNDIEVVGGTRYGTENSETGWCEIYEDLKIGDDRPIDEETTTSTTSSELDESRLPSLSLSNTHGESDISVDGLSYFGELDSDREEDNGLPDSGYSMRTMYYDHEPEQELEEDYQISESDEDEERNFSSIYSRMGQRRGGVHYQEFCRRRDQESCIQEDDGRGAASRERSGSARSLGRWEPWDEVCAEDLIENGLSKGGKEQESLILDLQGIPWSELPTNREQMRASRLNSYKNYENLAISRDTLQKDLIEVDSNYEYYRFKYSTMKEKSMIVHFQLRNLIWATGKHEVFYTGRSKAWSREDEDVSRAYRSVEGFFLPQKGQD
jgi:hypothetical protein